MTEQHLIERPLYLERLRAWKDNFDTIKVITGIRRCGKSKVLEYVDGIDIPDSQYLINNLDVPFSLYK